MERKKKIQAYWICSKGLQSGSLEQIKAPMELRRRNLCALMGDYKELRGNMEDEKRINSRQTCC